MGQWICPVCLNDSKSEERRHDESSRKPRVEQEIINEECARCRRELTVVYYYKGEKLCEFCARVERDDKGNLPNSMSVFRIGNKKKKGIFGKIVDLVRGKPRERDERKVFIEAVRNNEKKKKSINIDEEKIRALDEDELPGEKKELEKSEEAEKPKPFGKKEDEARFRPLIDKQKTKKEIFASFKSPKENYKIEVPVNSGAKSASKPKAQKKKRTSKKD